MKKSIKFILVITAVILIANFTFCQYIYSDNQ